MVLPPSNTHLAPPKPSVDTKRVIRTVKFIDDVNEAGGGSAEHYMSYAVLQTTGGRTYACELCPYRTRVPLHIRSHLTNHWFRAGYFKCDDCEYYVRLPHSLGQHKELHRRALDIVSVSWG